MGCNDSSMNNHLVDPSSQYFTNPPNKVPKSGFAPEETIKEFSADSIIKHTINRNMQSGLQKQGQGFYTTFQNSYQYLEELYSLSEGNLEVFFTELQEKISDIYMTISKETLQQMNQNSLINNQSKIQISQEILWFNLNILKIVGRKSDHKFNPTIFKQINKLQKNLVGYLKMKYPRGGQSFVPGDLMSVFKQFDMTEDLEYDILKNSGTYFGDQGDQVLSKQIKLFLNKIIDELDTHYPFFEKTMQQEVFVVTDQNGQKRTLNYKIGRKIPQNISKFTDLQSNTLEINSPQIFRVLIKWMTRLQDMLMQPSESINKKKNFKVFIEQNQDGSRVFDQINEDEYPDMINYDLMDKINSERDEYKASNDSLLVDMDRFNSHLLKLLDTSTRKQKFVPIKEMEIIKYSNLNAKFIAWVLAQKLMLALKKLIKVGKSFYNTKAMLNMDLIQFRLSDLMRAMVSGNKKQILAVYNNLKNLEKKGDIKIIKIKNRLATSLNDAMIIFSVKNSFLICQVQLILSDGGTQKTNQKYKNIQVLNHFFYELERSPYGILSEIAVLLAYKDSKVSYEDSITFESNLNLIQNCQNNHPNEVQHHKFQTKPFICSKCTVFYYKFENIFLMKHCRLCNTFICGKCLFQEDPKLQDKIIDKEINQEIDLKIQKTLSKLRDLSSAAGSSTVLKMFNSPFQKIKDIFKCKKKVQISKVIDYLNDKVGKVYKSYQFAIVSFRKGIAEFKCLNYKSTWKQIENPFNPKQTFHPKSNLYFSDYDMLLTFDLSSKESKIVRQNHIGDNLLYLFTDQQYVTQRLKSVPPPQIISYKAGDFNVIINIQLPEKRVDQSLNTAGVKIQKIFKYASLHEVTNNLPDLAGAKSILKFGDMGIQTSHLVFFKQIDWALNIKELKLSNNNIKQVDDVLTTCLKIERLYLNQNKLISLNFVKELPDIQILNCSNNLIDTISNIANIRNISKILLMNNKLSQFPKCSFPNIKILNLSGNSIDNSADFYQSEMPKLQQLNIEKNNQNKKLSTSNSITVPFPRLKILMGSNLTLKLLIQADKLERLYYQKSMIKDIELKSIQYLKIISLSQNNINNMDFIFPIKNNYQNNIITQINLSMNDIEVVPILKSTSLEKLIINYNVIKDIANFAHSNVPNLTQFNISSNKITHITQLPLPKLEKLNLSQNDIADASLLKNSQLESLKSLKLSQCDKLKEFPLLNLNSLQQLEMNMVTIQNMTKLSQSKLPKLSKIVIKDSSLPNFPRIQFEALEVLDLSRSTIQNIDNLQLSELNNLETLTIDGIRLPAVKNKVADEQKIRFITGKQFFCFNFNFPKLKSLKAKGAQNVPSYGGLQYCSLPSLQQLFLDNSKIQPMPPLTLKNLKCLSLTYCQLTEVDNILTQQLENLEEINLLGNMISKFDVNLASLKKVNLSSNKLTSFGSGSKEMQKLIELKISTNQFRQFPIIRASNLTVLSIDGNKFQNISALENCNIPKIEDLRIEYCNWKLSPVIPKMNLLSVKSLYFKNNQINNILNLQFSNMPCVEDINFSINSIQKIPKVDFPNLKFFRLNKNKISDIEALAQSNLPELMILQLQTNLITKLPYMPCPNLKKIFMHENNCKDVSEWVKSPIKSFLILNICKSTDLTELPILQCKFAQIYANETGIKHIKEVNDFKNLIKVQLNRNGITHAPKLNQKYLQMLQLQNNLLTDIDQLATSQLPNVTQFSIKGNQIKVMPKLNMVGLLRAYFNQNVIQDVTQFCKSDLPRLNMLSFQANQIKHIPSLPFKALGSIYLSKNPLEQVKFFNEPEYPKMNMFVAATTSIKEVQVFPKMIALQKMWFNTSKLQSIQWLADSGDNLPNLTLFAAPSNNVSKLPNLHKIKSPLKLMMGSNPFTDLSGYLDTPLEIRLKHTSMSISMKVDDPTTFNAKYDQIKNKAGTAQHKLLISQFYA